jgi:hypothetical protein
MYCDTGRRCGLPFAGGQGGEFGELHCKLGHAVQIETVLRPESPKNGEFFKYPPETIGSFAPEPTKFGVWRQTANLHKPAIGGPFWHCRG